MRGKAPAEADFLLLLPPLCRDSPVINYRDLAGRASGEKIQGAELPVLRVIRREAKDPFFGEEGGGFVLHFNYG